MITRSEVLMGREIDYPLSAELETNLSALLYSVNVLRAEYGKPMRVSSGYRPGHFNSDAGGAINSTHKLCMGVDFHDRDGAIKSWLTESILERCGLYMEDPRNTSTWVHVQIRPTKNRIFRP